MLRVRLLLYIKRNLLLSVILASDLPLRTIKFHSVLFGEVVNAGCDKQDSLMRGGLRGKRRNGRHR